MTTAGHIRDEASAAYAEAAGPLSREDRAALLGWLVLSRIGELAPGADVPATSLAWYDELRMAPVIAGGFRLAGLDEAASWRTADQVRVLLALPRPSTIRGRGRNADLRLIEAWLTRDTLRAAMGVNTWEGIEWLDRDRFETVLRWAARLDAIEKGESPDDKVVKRLSAAAEAARYRVDALLASLAPRPARTTRTPAPERSEPTAET